MDNKSMSQTSIICWHFNSWISWPQNQHIL